MRIQEEIGLMYLTTSVERWPDIVRIHRRIMSLKSDLRVRFEIYL